jgi:valyl-tRNA synthetase
MIGNPKHIIEMKVQHPLFPEREIPIIPHKTCPFGVGTGFLPVNPAHNIDDNEHAEIFNLPTKGFVNKNGEYKFEYLGEEYKNRTIEDEDFIY